MIYNYFSISQHLFFSAFFFFYLETYSHINYICLSFQSHFLDPFFSFVSAPNINIFPRDLPTFSFISPPPLFVYHPRPCHCSASSAGIAGRRDVRGGFVLPPPSNISPQSASIHNDRLGCSFIWVRLTLCCFWCLRLIAKSFSIRVCFSFGFVCIYVCLCMCLVCLRLLLSFSISVCFSLIFLFFQFLVIGVSCVFL